MTAFHRDAAAPENQLGTAAVMAAVLIFHPAVVLESREQSTVLGLVQALILMVFSLESGLADRVRQW